MRTIRDLAVGAMPATVAALSLLSSLAWPATGDLDPGFGQLGEITLPGTGTAWSIQPQGAGYVLGGGSQQSTIDPDIVIRNGFVLRFDADGASEPWYTDKLVRDIAVDAQGGVIGVGREAFRLTPDGALDPTFGTDGVVDSATDFPILEATSVVLDDAGRSVIAATTNGALTVLRLLTSGELDASFGAGGVFTGPTHPVQTIQLPPSPQIVRVSGGYRVTVNSVESLNEGPAWRCWIVALQGDGAIDSTFGDAGYVVVHLQLDRNAHCTALAAQADGRLLVAGSDREHGFAIRLLENGQLDTGFTAPDVAERMSGATALAVTGTGGVLVAGLDVIDRAGALVVSLSSDGTLDTSFGNDGATWLVRSGAATAVVRRILPLADHDVLLAGGGSSSFGPARSVGTPFVFRLTGDPHSVSPGVVSLPRFLGAALDATQVVLSVRRTGGSAGEVSVAYETRDFTSEEAQERGVEAATEGADYFATRGLLTWSNGEYEDKQIVVPLISTPSAEQNEAFELRLSDVQGGAILVSSTAEIVIQAHAGSVPDDDGAPTGVGGGSSSCGGAVSLWSLLLLGGLAAGRLSCRVRPWQFRRLSDPAGTRQKNGIKEREGDRRDHDRLLPMRDRRRDRGHHDGAHGAGRDRVVGVPGHLSVRGAPRLSRLRA